MAPLANISLDVIIQEVIDLNLGFVPLVHYFVIICTANMFTNLHRFRLEATAGLNWGSCRLLSANDFLYRHFLAVQLLDRILL